MCIDRKKSFPWKRACLLSVKQAVFFIACIMLFFVMISVTPGFCDAPVKQGAQSKAVRGVIDFTGIDLTRSGAVKLDGEWEFYWKKLIGPDDFRGKDIPVPDGYYQVPRFWTGYGTSGYPSRGFATYRLTVKTPGHHKPLSIQTPEIFSEYRLWIDGKVVDQHGSFIGKPVRFLKPDVFAFPCQGDAVEIILQIKNSSHGNAGIGQSFMLGSPEQIGRYHRHALIIEVILIAICFFAGFYHLVLFSFRTDERELLFFGLFCIVIAVRTFFTGTTYIMQIFPDMSFEVGSRLATATIPLSVITFFLFAYYFFKPLVNRYVFRVLLSANLLYLCIIPVTTTFFYSTAFTWYFAVIGASCLYIVLITITGIVKRFRYAGIFLGGFVFVFIGVINDMLHYKQVINTGYQLALWFSAFIIAHSIMLAIKFSNEHQIIEQLSKRLQVLDRLKDEFLANTSHELRTPINGIIGISESLIDGVTGELPEKTLQNLRVISSSGKRLSSLINDILDFSRLRNNDIIIQKKQIDLQQLVGIVMTVVKATMPGKDVAMINDIPDDFPYIEGDENRLQQVMYNLIGNAFKFTPEGHVKVTADEWEGAARICVEDTGIGIKPGMEEDIFKSFEQVDGSLSREYGGTGLGLSITKRLVELHGGKIWAESGPGKGSKFYFTVKISSDTGLESADFSMTPVISDVEAVISDTGGNKNAESREQILVVDDEWINIQVLLNYLSGKHFSIDYAPNGIEALEKIEKKRYDLVLLDIMMPKMSGYEVCRELRKKYTSYELPVLMLTAKNQTNDIITSFNVGANDYLEKPFDKNELLARIETHLSLKMAVENAITNARLANIDHLTGLYNRRFFWEAGGIEFNRARRNNENLSVIMLDIDRFKNINDSFGHHVGDLVIRQLAVIISRNIRGVDIPGRYGGEEFIVILPGTDSSGAMFVAEKIRKLAEMEKVDSGNDGSLNFTVSIGVASCHNNIDNFEYLVRQSDEMLYRAKEGGRNRVEGK